MNRNARTCLAVTPLWSVAYSLSFFYLSLYFRACGVSDAQLGTLVTAGAASSVVFSFLGASLVDRMGRRNSTLVFDLAGSALPMILFAIDGRFAAALAGSILSNAARVMNIGFALLMTEDSDDGERSTAFNVFNIVFIAAGLIVPLAGTIVEKAGILSAERSFLALAAAVMTILALLRYRYTSETRTGNLLMERLKAGRMKAAEAGDRAFLPAWKALLAPYGTALRFLSSDRKAAGVVAANVLFYVYYSVGTIGSFYFAPFFADALGMDARTVSLVGAVFSAGTLLSMVLVNPCLLRKVGPRTASALGAVLNICGLLPLVFLGSGSPFPVFFAVGFASLGYGMIKSGIDAALSTCFGDGKPGGGAEEARAGVYAISNLASSVLVMGFGGLSALLYASTPRLVPVLSTTLLAAVLVMLGSRPNREAGPASPAGSA